MTQYEIIGIVVIGLTALVTLISQIIKPFKNLANAIHSLEKLMERFIVVQDNQEDRIDVLILKIERLEERMNRLELRCASNNYMRDKAP